MSSENPIHVEDNFNPYPETWVDACEAHIGGISPRGAPTEVLSPTSSGEKQRTPWSGSNEARVVQKHVFAPGTGIGSGNPLQVIEEIDEEERICPAKYNAKIKAIHGECDATTVPVFCGLFL